MLNPKAVKMVNERVSVLADTSVSAFQDKKLITYICDYAWFSLRKYDEKRVEQLIDEYNTFQSTEENDMAGKFSDTYFSREDCSKIRWI